MFGQIANVVIGLLSSVYRFTLGSSTSTITYPAGGTFNVAVPSGTVFQVDSGGNIRVSGGAYVGNLNADAGIIRAAAGVVEAFDAAGATMGSFLAASYLHGATAGGATSSRSIILKKTGIADNSATSVITVTVPNANHAACVKLRILSSNGSTDAFESSRCAEGLVVVARTSGLATVAAAATLTLTQIATVAAGATHTLAYGVTSISGANNATQTFDITVTIDDSGNLGSNQAVVLAEVLNAEATGVTIAAA